MGIGYNPRITTDGLVLCLDAGNVKSYPGSGATWFDISGNQNHGPLVVSPTFDSANGSFVFNGSNTYVNTALTTAFSDFTACVWFKDTGAISGFERLVEKSFTTGFWIGRNVTSANSWGGGVREGSAPYGRFITLTDGQWHYIVSSRRGTTHTIYGDGITNKTSGTVSSTALNTNNVLLGLYLIGDPSGALSGSIAQVSIYNRALSEAEILQNFNALRGRFGI